MRMSNSRDKAAERRSSLLDAAIDVFAQHGYQGATMEQIARRAGVAKGTPYLHFSDKADLFYAVFEKWMGEIMVISEQAMAKATNTRERLLAMAFSALDYMDAHRDWFPLTLEVWSASVTPALRDRFADIMEKMYAGYRSQVASLIRAGQACGELRVGADPDALAALLTGAIDGLLLQTWFDPTLNAREAVQGFFDALFTGIAVDKGGHS